MSLHPYYNSARSECFPRYEHKHEIETHLPGKGWRRHRSPLSLKTFFPEAFPSSTKWSTTSESQTGERQLTVHKIRAKWGKGRCKLLIHSARPLVFTRFSYSVCLSLTIVISCASLILSAMRLEYWQPRHYKNITKRQSADVRGWVYLSLTRGRRVQAMCECRLRWAVNVWFRKIIRKNKPVHHIYLSTPRTPITSDRGSTWRFIGHSQHKFNYHVFLFCQDALLLLNLLYTP